MHLHADDTRTGDVMLACAHQATHSIIFGGFSSDASWSEQRQTKLVVTADGGWRRGKVVPLKTAVDESLEKSPSVERSSSSSEPATTSRWSPTVTTGGTT